MSVNCHLCGVEIPEGWYVIDHEGRPACSLCRDFGRDPSCYRCGEKHGEILYPDFTDVKSPDVLRRQICRDCELQMVGAFEGGEIIRAKLAKAGFDYVLAIACDPKPIQILIEHRDIPEVIFGYRVGYWLWNEFFAEVSVKEEWTDFERSTAKLIQPVCLYKPR